VLELIAEYVTDNIRALEGALIRVVAFHSLTGQPIDRALTQRVLESMGYSRPDPQATSTSRPSRNPTVSIEDVQRVVAARFGLEIEELNSAGKTARIVWPRQLAMQLARDLTGAPLAEVGSAFGGRSHATVVHACRQVSKRMSTDHQAIVDHEELTRALRSSDRGC
jgi:chromosomal replication initiator protein